MYLYMYMYMYRYMCVCVRCANDGRIFFMAKSIARAPVSLAELAIRMEIERDSKLLFIIHVRVNVTSLRLYIIIFPIRFFENNNKIILLEIIGVQCVPKQFFQWPEGGGCFRRGGRSTAL